MALTCTAQRSRYLMQNVNDHNPKTLKMNFKTFLYVLHNLCEKSVHQGWSKMENIEA